MDTPNRGCVGDDSSGKVVGVSAWYITHAWHTLVNTSVDSMYIIFWFLRYKNLYILFSKSICSIKKILVVSNLVLARRGSKNDFDCPWAFKYEIETTDSFIVVLHKCYKFYFMILCWYYEIFNLNSSSSQLCSTYIYLNLSFF